MSLTLVVKILVVIATLVTGFRFGTWIGDRHERNVDKTDL
jgi:hypothetical protein